MKYLTTPDQRLIMNVLGKTGWLREDQAGRFLKGADSGYTLRVLSQLRYMQEAYFKGDSVISLPRLSRQAPDQDMLAAIDVMLDISGGDILAISCDKAPFKLCFLTESGTGIASYAVAAAGTNPQKDNFLLTDASSGRTIILIIPKIEDVSSFSLPKPHFFAVRDHDGRGHRYFESGG